MPCSVVGRSPSQSNMCTRMAAFSGSVQVPATVGFALIFSISFSALSALAALVLPSKCSVKYS